MTEMMTEIMTEKYGNNDNNTAVGSGSYGPIFDPITTPWSRLSIMEEDRTMTATVLWPWCTMYVHIGIYIFHINIMVNMCHKLMYAKIGVLDLCC